MNFRKGSKILIVCSIVLCATLAMAQAPSTIFELDGTAGPLSGPGPANCTYTAASQPCDYWNLINSTGSSGAGRGHSVVNTFIAGSSSTNAFTGGHSKDALPLSGWAYSSSNTPPKDGLNAGYAAAYSISDFDVIFGADRFEGSGDANIGIWFFQNQVSLNGTGGFSGSHANGDVFVVSSFVNGGGNPVIAAYAWNQPGLPNAITSNDGQNGCSSASNNNPKVGDCAAGNLLVLVAQGVANCTSGNFTCAIANTGTVNAKWATYNSPSGTITSPFFFSGGIDITHAFAAVGGTAPCFASFLEETRSSQSISAVLKDFLLGGFPVCSMSITKNCPAGTANSAGTAFNYNPGGVVTNTGIGTLYDVQVFDTIAPATTPGPGINVSNNTGTPATNPDFGTNTLRAGDTGTWSDPYTSASTSVADSAYALASETPNGSQTLQSTNTAQATCAAQANTQLTITKSCSTTLQVSSGAVSVLVSYGGTITNAGPSKVTGITLEDYPDSSNINGAGTPLTGSYSLDPGTSVNYGPLTYSPSLIDQTIQGSDGIAGDGPGRFFFSDLVTITAATPTIGTLKKVVSSDPRTNGTYGFGTASCPICQGSGECTP
jgi:hypothetical protein